MTQRRLSSLKAWIMLSSIAATGPPTMVTKAAVLIRHHHLTLFWKYSAHRGRWALNKMREGGNRGQSYHYLNVTIICLEYPGKQPTFYYQKTKQNKTPNLKNSERCLVTEKQAIYRKDTWTSEKILDHGHVNTNNKISFWMHQTGKD